MRRTPRLLALILLTSVAARLIVAVYLGDTIPPEKDETSYHTLAARAASGFGYSFPAAWYPFTPPDTPTSHWSFLYTALLAAIYRLAGPHPLAGRAAGAIAGGLLLPWLTYRLARRMAPRADGRLPLLAAALAAAYAYFVLFAAQLMTETFFLCALLWSLERSLALETALAPGSSGSRLPALAIGLGLSLAAAALLRQSILPWVALLSAWLLWRGWRGGGGRRVCAALLLAGLILATCVLPFTVRNLRVFDGHFLLLNSNAGYAMYSSQHPGHGTSFREYWAAPLPTDLASRGLDEAQWDRELMRRGVGFVLEAPGRYLLLSLSRVPDYVEFWPTAGSSALFNLGRALSIGALLPFMIAGAALWLRPGVRRAYGLASPTLLLLFMASYSLLHIFTWAMSRYRLPVDAVALPFAALALLALGQALARRRVAA